MQLKIIAISMAKNEIDIIEAFVRHTLSFVSHLVILDDDSTDGTLEILKALKQEGLNLTVIENKEPGLSQFLIMNRLMSDQAIKTHNADWVLPLDADEFVSTIDGKSLINDDVPTNQVLSLQWRNYLPHTTDKKGVLNPVLRIKNRAKENYQKIAGTILIPAKIASLPDALITTGNHNIEIGGVISELKPHPHAYLGHFQIRSKNQFLTKNLIKRLQLRITILPKLPEFNPYFSLHNQRQLNSIKENASMFEEDFLNASQIWLENYKGENVDLVEDQFLYQGGDLKYSHIITSNQGWLTVFNFCEMLASRHGALLSTLDHKGKELFEEESKIITSLRLNLDKMLDDLLEKEKVIQDQHRHLLEKEQIIQDLRRHLLEKEQVIQDQRHRLRFYLKNTFKKFERIRLKIKMAFLYCASLVRQIIDIIIRPS